MCVRAARWPAPPMSSSPQQTKEMKKKTATQAAPRDGGRAKEAPPRVTRRGRARRLFRRPKKQPPLEHAGLESIAAFEYRPPGDDGL